jgi:hypothetical protein
VITSTSLLPPFALLIADASWEIVDLEVRVEAFDFVDFQLTLLLLFRKYPPRA